MPGSEFQLIQSYFSDPEQIERSDVVLGIGDDCAIVAPRERSHLVFSIDTLISGVHFPHNTSPEAIAHKALAVNLSDLAAMGAEPAWFTISLTLPDVNNHWLKAFSQSLFSLAKEHNIQLIGGDTTRGSLSITIQVAGYIEEQGGLRRAGAKEGDIIAVTGNLGAAALGLDIALQKNTDNYACLSEIDKQSALQALNFPLPQIDAGLSLRNIAHSALDLSDGLYADLGHILEASNVAAIIELEKLPLAKSLNCMKQEAAWEKALTGGDDYELCFTLAFEDWLHVQRKHPEFTAVGKVVTHQANQNRLRLLTKDAEEFIINSRGYDHFG